MELLRASAYTSICRCSQLLAPEPTLSASSPPRSHLLLLLLTLSMCLLLFPALCGFFQTGCPVLPSLLSTKPTYLEASDHPRLGVPLNSLVKPDGLFPPQPPSVGMSTLSRGPICISRHQISGSSLAPQNLHIQS